MDGAAAAARRSGIIGWLSYEHAEPTTGERLRTWVREDFGVDLLSIERIGHGADEAAVLWRGVTVDGAPYAAKLSGGGTSAGMIVAAHLAEHGVPGVVGAVRTRQGLLWGERDGRRLSVVPWVSGERALNGRMSTQCWRSFGALLATVHATAVTDVLAKALPGEDHTHDAVASVVRAVDDRLRGSVSEATEQDPADHLVRALTQEWCAAAGHVFALLEQADRLGRKLRTHRAAGVVCHGDPHLGNVLIGGDEQVWLVDWDDAVLAPRERDLMFVVGGVLAFAPVGPAEQAWFFEGYGGADLDPTRLAYYRCTRALVDVADPAAQVVDSHRFSETERAEALSIVRGVLSETGLVNLALSSLRDLGLMADESDATGSGVAG